MRGVEVCGNVLRTGAVMCDPRLLFRIPGHMALASNLPRQALSTLLCVVSSHTVASLFTCCVHRRCHEPISPRGVPLPC